MRITDLITVLSVILWLAVVGFVILSSVQTARGQKIKNARMITIILAVSALLTTVLSAGLVFVEPEERGVVISALAPKGYREEALQPGLRWVMPFVERVELYPISRQAYTMSIATNEGAI